MSQNNLFDVDQADMLLHYSNEKKNRSTCITSPVNTKMIEDLLVTFRSAIIDKNQKKAISIYLLSDLRNRTLYKQSMKVLVLMTLKSRHICGRKLGNGTGSMVHVVR